MNYRLGNPILWEGLKMAVRYLCSLLVFVLSLGDPLSFAAGEPAGGLCGEC